MPDLSPHTYSNAPGVGQRLLAVGWLDPAHRFPAGPVPDGFEARLARLCATATVARTRGIHPCRLPPCTGARVWPPLSIEVDGRAVHLGGAEIRVGFGTGTWFAAPDLVCHYVTAHGYRPPDEFVAAVLRGDADHGS
ncbi:MAG TPA: hypothetical protein VF755_29790 [Catenuloplanes sp.]